MNKIEKLPYDIWLNWSVTDKCIFSCDYCFSKNTFRYFLTDLINQLRKVFRMRQYSIPAINVDKTIHSLKRTGKIFAIGIVGGGEPFLVPNIVEFCIALARKHYLSVVSNFVLPSVRTFLEEVPSDHVLSMVASLHIEQLLSRNLFQRFVDNVHFAKERGFNVSVHTVAYPSVYTKIMEIKRLFDESCIEFEIKPYIGQYNGKFYPESYKDEEKIAFGFKNYHLDASLSKDRLCNAGYNAAYVDSKGNIFYCASFKKKIGNIYDDFSLKKTLFTCSVKTCGCCYPIINKSLFNKAIIELM